jgi:hypothetical protein
MLPCQTGPSKDVKDPNVNGEMEHFVERHDYAPKTSRSSAVEQSRPSTAHPIDAHWVRSHVGKQPSTKPFFLGPAGLTPGPRYLCCSIGETPLRPPQSVPLDSSGPSLSRMRSQLHPRDVFKARHKARHFGWESRPGNCILGQSNEPICRLVDSPAHRGSRPTPSRKTSPH